MAKSKSITKSSTNSEKATTGSQLVQQWRAIRSEVRKVTWPTREEARTLTIAVTVGSVIIALFLYMVDALFQVVVGGIVALNPVWIIAALILCALLAFAFYSNSREE